MADTSHPDSIDSQDPNQHPDEKKTKSRRPANTAFRQQRLKAWQPILTPKTVLPLFFAIGIIFAPIGGGLLFASSTVQELRMDYSNCHTDAPLWGPEDLQTDPTAKMPSSAWESHFKSNEITGDPNPTWSRQFVTQQYGGNVSVGVWQCQLNFTVQHELTPPIFFYYRLTNFYQNHRRYAKSFNTDQLSGKAVSLKAIRSSDCTPLATPSGVDKPYYPCGLAANSVFNDTFFTPTPLGFDWDFVMTNNDIAWDSDRKLYGKTAYNLSDVVPPPNWMARYPYGYTEDNQPDLANDEEFQVWMRLAGLPTFSKLAMKNVTQTMKAGKYSLLVNSHFNVTEYGGTKSIIISTGTVMGGRNPFLGIAYVVVGGICIVLGSLFTVTHLIKPRKLGDHTYLSWNNDNPAAGGVATGGRDGVLGGERA
ncbi:hypothetical protein HYALB_00010613 [Hymenoscyphus albidus]|uniref:Lem3/Cdc50 n=1 Tax=Hymenoscyphus albidus TaxID=595503 RepID=A0A9N9LPZ6_9HELO|nr:hypothetical protein HYALB_00010613 [Hymenoscyphus albidus]